MSDNKQWFSAKVRLVAIVEGMGAVDYMDCAHVFQARDWKDAQSRAVQLGRSHEKEYINADGNKLRWLLKEILNMDYIRSDALDGAEVHSQMQNVPEHEKNIPFDIKFHPEDSVPATTL